MRGFKWAVPVAVAGAMRRMLVGVALVVVTVGAMPMQAAVGAPPHRSPIRGPVANFDDGDSIIIKESEWSCSFSALFEVDGQGIDWTFSDGHEASSNVAPMNITNLETGKTYVHRSDYHRTITFQADGTELWVIDGTFFLGLLAGDQGPEGEVGRGGADYFVTGHQSFVYDPKVDAVTSYEGDGQALDVCQVLSA
jgi:hypothetical protein